MKPTYWKSLYPRRRRPSSPRKQGGGQICRGHRYSCTIIWKIRVDQHKRKTFEEKLETDWLENVNFEVNYTKIGQESFWLACQMSGSAEQTFWDAHTWPNTASTWPEWTMTCQLCSVSSCAERTCFVEGRNPQIALHEVYRFCAVRMCITDRTRPKRRFITILHPVQKAYHHDL